MRDMTAVELPIVVRDSHLCRELQVVELKPPLQERVVKSVSIVASNDVRTVILYKLSKLQERILF